jgi:hypothetical protein
MPMIDEPPWPFLMTLAQHANGRRTPGASGVMTWRFITSSPPA